MLEDDELALSGEINEHQLETSSCILFERHVHPYLCDLMLRATKPAAKPGNSLHHVMTAEEASHLVLRGLGIAILTQAGAWRIARNGIAIRPLNVDGIRLETRLACRSDSRARVVGEFLRSFVRRLQQQSSGNQMRLGFAG